VVKALRMKTETKMAKRDKEKQKDEESIRSILEAFEEEEEKDGRSEAKLSIQVSCKWRRRGTEKERKRFEEKK
jgi:hypothetical protein